MDAFPKQAPASAYQVIWKDAIDCLFTCGKCGHSLVEALVYARPRLAALLDVHCANCHELWAFVRLPQGLYEKHQLDREAILAARQLELPPAPETLRRRRTRFWAAASRLFK